MRGDLGALPTGRSFVLMSDGSSKPVPRQVRYGFERSALLPLKAAKAIAATEQSFGQKDDTMVISVCCLPLYGFPNRSLTFEDIGRRKPQVRCPGLLPSTLLFFEQQQRSNSSPAYATGNVLPLPRGAPDAATARNCASFGNIVKPLCKITSAFETSPACLWMVAASKK